MAVARKRCPKITIYAAVYILYKCALPGILMKCGCANQKHLIRAEPLHCGVEIVNCNVNAA